jgi:hypothetical protein
VRCCYKSKIQMLKVGAIPVQRVCLVTSELKWVDSYQVAGDPR